MTKRNSHFASVGKDMPEELRNYQAISDMEPQRVLWKRFHVYEAGNTNGAHRPIVQWFRTIGQTEVNTSEESDYLLVFCPAVSRVGTDIGEALNNMPPGRPVILVVMHHTFNRRHVVAESWRQVNDPNVCLTVDCLFYEGRLLDGNLNDIMWGDIRKFFGVSPVTLWIHSNKVRLIAVLIFGVVIFTGVVFWLTKIGRAQGNHSNPNN